VPRYLPSDGNRLVVGMNWRERELVDELNPRRHRILADDKILGKELLATHGVPVPATLAVIEDMRDVARIKHMVGDHEHFVIKPARGKAGAGIAVLGPKLEDGWHGSSRTVWDEGDIRHLLGNILTGEYAMRTWDRALIEERIFAGPVLGDEAPMGLPDIRVITLHGSPVMAMVRLPTKRSMGKANLHLGALGIGIDMQTGVTTGGTCRGRLVTRHPETSTPLAGMKVTAWEDVIDTSTRAARAFPLGYLGVDISITQEGRPVVLEVNVRPGLEIQNANRRGLRAEISRVLAAQRETDQNQNDIH
jgi:alpha-L-glutamate ligase-like protein